MSDVAAAEFADAEIAETQPKVDGTLKPAARIFYDKVIEESLARSRIEFNRNERKKRVPTEASIPSNYLGAVTQFIENPNSPFINELLHKNVKDKVDIRFSLQTTFNYLLIRNLQNRSGDDEKAILENIKQHTANSDPVEAIKSINQKVREEFPQDEIETFLPDCEEKSIAKDKLNVRQIATLAKLILREDEHKPKDQYSPVHERCKKIFELTPESDPNFNVLMLFDPNLRRQSLELLVDNMSDDTSTINFIDRHDQLTQPILYHLEKNRGLLVKMLLNDLELGKPKIFRKGELVKKIGDLLGESPEKEFLVSRALSIEDRMYGPLTRLIDPSTGEYKDTLVEFLESKKALKSEIANLPDEKEPELSPLITTVKFDSSIIEKGVDLEKIAPGIGEEIFAAVDKHIKANLREYSHAQVEIIFGLSRGELLTLQREEYLKPEKTRKANYHPFFTPTEAIAARVFNKFYGVKMNHKERNSVYKLIGEMLALSLPAAIGK